MHDVPHTKRGEQKQEEQVVAPRSVLEHEKEAYSDFLTLRKVTS